MILQTLIFWLLVLLVVQPFRLRLAAVAFLAISHVDMSGPGFDSAGSVGWENAFKSLVLPVWLAFVVGRVLLRQGRLPVGRLLTSLVASPFFALWLAFVGYVGVAVLWSPYPLAGVKLLMALLSHTLVFVVLLLLWLSGRLDARTVLVALALAFAIGFVQTHLLGNAFGTGEFVTRPRFTSFAGPQSFAENLVTLGSVLLWSPGGYLAMVPLVALTFLSGSRIGFAGALAAVGIWLLCRLEAKRIVLVALLLAAPGLLLFSETVRQRAADTRIGEAVASLSAGALGIQDVGTFRWRDSMYRCFWEDLRMRGSVETIFGSGTAGVGSSGLRCEPNWSADSFSPNRVAHNEFLRTAYDWGLVGLLLALPLLGGLLALSWKCFRASRGGPGFRHLGPLASATPLLLLALSFESILQGPLSPGSLGFLAIITQAVAERLRRRAMTWEAW